MSAYRQIYLVAARDFRERVTSRAFQISTALTVILIAAFVLLPSILGVDDAPTWDVGTVGAPHSSLEIALKTAASNPDTIVSVADAGTRDQLEEAIRDGTYDAGVDGGEIIEGNDTSSELVALLVAVSGSLDIADRATELGLSQDDLASLLGGGASVVPVDPEEGDSASTSNEGDRVLAFFGVIFLFISIVTDGQWILIGPTACGQARSSASALSAWLNSSWSERSRSSWSSSRRASTFPMPQSSRQSRLSCGSCSGLRSTPPLTPPRGPSCRVRRKRRMPRSRSPWC